MLIREHSDVRLQTNKFVPLAEGRDIRINIPQGKVESDVSKHRTAPGRFWRYKRHQVLPQFVELSFALPAWPMRRELKCWRGKLLLATSAV